MDRLAAYGWNSLFAQHLGADDSVPARVISEQRELRGGRLGRSHYENYVKLLKEQDYQRRREDPVLNARTKRRWKSMTKEMRLVQKLKRDEE